MGDAYELIMHPERAEYIKRKGLLKIGLCCPLLIFLMFIHNFTSTPPVTTLQKIYIPSLDKNKNASTDTTLTFEINIQSTNLYTATYYDPLNVTFYDGPNRVHLIANFTAPHFTQYDSVVHKGGTINTTVLFDMKRAMDIISFQGYWIIRVDLATSFRYKWWWKTKTHNYKVGANINIGDTGIKVHHKDNARLVSGTAKIGSTFNLIGVLFINLIVMFILCSCY